MLTEIIVFTGLAFIVCALYRLATKNDDYFLRRGVQYMDSNFGTGQLIGFLMGRYSQMEFAEWTYKAFPGEKINGFYAFNRPVFMLRHPEVIKKLTSADFEYFENHKIFMMNEEDDELFGNSLFLMKGQKWRDMRASLSPAFTGNKMRLMFELVSECAEDMVEYLREEAHTSDGALDKEFKDLFMRCTTDVTATTGFGLKTNSLRDRDNEFLCAGRNLLKFDGIKAILRVFLLAFCPRVAKAFDIQLISKDVRDFFGPMVFHTMNTRKRENIFRPDALNMLMEMREGGSVKRTPKESEEKGDAGFATVEESEIGRKAVQRKWTDVEILAQSFIFFFGGLDNSSNALLFTAYELALNPDIQAKLFDEIRTMNDEIEGKRITYELLQKMKYLDQVICEMLRKWPPISLTDRICTKDYVYDDGNGKKFRIEKDTSVWISIYGVHRDPQYYPDPERFDPERFNDDNKKNIVAGTYIPFGIGPRNCIGSRYALMQVKAILYYLLLHFSIEVSERTIIPMTFKKSPMNVKVDHDVYLRLQSRH